MGHLLEALKQIDARTPLHQPVKATTAPRCPSDEPAQDAAAGGKRVAGADREPATPVDPRYRELLGAILSQVAVRGSLTLLMAGFAKDEPRGGQLAGFYPLLGSRIEGGVLVVDADFRNAGLTGRFELAPEPSIVEVLSGRFPWQNAVRGTKHAGLYVVPMASEASETAPIGPESWSPLLSDLRQTHRLVVVDTVLPTPAEIARWSAVCDVTVLTVRLGITPRRDVRDTLRMIQSRGGEGLGCVLLES